MSALAIALDIIGRGYSPVPVPVGKKPNITNWPKLRITAETAPRYFNGARINAGAIMGPASNGLTDVDLDCAEAVALAPHFLPRTGSIYGRPGKRRSHYLYKASDPAPKAYIRLSDENNSVIVELRMGGGGKGAQSIWPGSTHPSGEKYEWDEDGTPAAVACADLKVAITKIAIGTILTRAWPRDGRHEAALALPGFLARAGWPSDDIRHFVEVVAEAANDEGIEDRVRAANDVIERHERGENVYGLPALSENFGEDAAEKVAKIIGYRDARSRTDNEGFELNKYYMPEPKSQANIRRAMELLDVTVSYDSFHDQMLIDGLEDFDLLDDAAVERLWLLIDERYRFLPAKDFFFTVVKETARRRTFHPVRQYLNSLTWDGTERLDKWLTTYTGAIDTEYTRSVGALMLIAAVRRVRKPGCKFDEMVVLENPTQGGDKSTLLATLAEHDDWFSDDLPLNADSQRVIERTRGRWIIEAAELSGMKKADIEHLKAFLSRQCDRARMAYGRFVDDVSRQFIIVGTTNNSEYLLDPTGNRRFWPIKTEQVDIAALRRDRDQLWAEAAAREAKGESIRLARELWPAASVEQEARRTRDPWEDALANVPQTVPRYARDETTGQPVEVGQTTIIHQEGEQQLVSSKDLLEYVLKVPVGHQDTRHSMRLAHAMKLAGWHRNPNGKVSIGGQRIHGYWRRDAM